MVGVPRLGFIRRAPAATAAAALRREITRGSLKTCRKSEVRLECSPVSLYACGECSVRVYVRLKKDLKEGRRQGERGEGPLTVCVCVSARRLCVRVFEEKHISLLLLPPSLFFLPADLHSRWVGSLLLPVLLSRSLCLLPSPREQRERFNPERALFPFYARIATRNCVARPAARKNRGNGAHLLSALLLLLLPCLSPFSLSFSFYDRAAIAAPALT